MLVAIIILCAFTKSDSVTAATSDPLFFGTYCGTKSIPVDVPACFWFICWPDEERFNLELKAFANYQEPRSGQGVVIGKGVATVSGGVDRRVRDLYGVYSGKEYPFVFSGLVKRRGLLKGSGGAVGMGSSASTARLSSDGETITMDAFDLGTVELGKAECGNDAPTATIFNPNVDGTSYPWGKVNFLHGRAEDREDAIGDLKMLWESDKDPGWRVEQFGKTSVNTQDLSTGEHNITFTVTDGGGRQAIATRRIIITNEQPNAPVIVEPADRASFTAGQCVPFRGRASDYEDGNLTGSSLEWTSNRLSTILIGTGNQFVCRPPDCSLLPGEHTITLTAIDNTGTSRSTSRRITIEPRGGSNTPPSVWIQEPHDWYIMAAQDEVALVARFCDLEDEVLGDDKFEWIVNEVVPGGVLEPIPASELIGSGAQIMYNPDYASPRYEREKQIEVKVQVTDNNGDSRTSEPITIVVIPGIGLY